MDDMEKKLFHREKREYADSCKVLIHKMFPEGENTRHQYIYENKDGELRNYLFITDKKDNFIIPYRNYLGEIFDHIDMPVSKSMEPLGPEVKIKFSYFNKEDILTK